MKSRKADLINAKTQRTDKKKMISTELLIWQKLQRIRTENNLESMNEAVKLTIEAYEKQERLNLKH